MTIFNDGNTDSVGPITIQVGYVDYSGRFLIIGNTTFDATIKPTGALYMGPTFLVPYTFAPPILNYESPPPNQSGVLVRAIDAHGESGGWRPTFFTQ